MSEPSSLLERAEQVLRKWAGAHVAHYLPCDPDKGENINAWPALRWCIYEALVDAVREPTADTYTREEMREACEQNYRAGVLAGFERCAQIADKHKYRGIIATAIRAENIGKSEERSAMNERVNALKPVICPACGRVGDPKTIVAQCEHSGTGPTIKCALRGMSEERTTSPNHGGADS